MQLPDLNELGKFLQKNGKVVNELLDSIPEEQKAEFEKQLEYSGYTDTQKQLDKAMAQLNIDLSKLRSKL